MADPTPAQDQPTAVRGFARLMGILGVRPDTTGTAQQPSLSSPASIRPSVITEVELRHMRGFGASKDTPSGITSDHVFSLFRASLSDNGNRARLLESVKTLTPEIGKAEQIYVSTIMAPNDLQTGKLRIVVDVPSYPPHINDALSNILSTYFNKSFELPTRFQKWLRTAMFVEGSASILVFPKENINILNRLVDVVKPDNAAPYLQGKAEARQEAYIEPWDVPSLCALETWLPKPVNAKAPNHFIEEIVDDCVGDIYELAMEAFSNGKEVPNPKTQDAFTKETAKTLATGVVQSVNDLIRKNNQTIKVSLYPDPKMFAMKSQATASAMSKHQNKIDQSFFGSAAAPIYNMCEDTPDNDSDHPGVVEFPAQMVIPVCVPGEPKNHIGYFVLVDQFGAPVADVNGGKTWSDQMIFKAANALFGGATGGSQVSAGSGKVFNTNTAYGYDAAATIFGMTIKHMLRSQLSTLGLDGMDIGKHEAVTNCLFRHLLMERRVSMIFVPESMMTYMRFDHRPDGTGKSRLEEIEMLVAFRNTLVLSNLYAAASASINKTKITLSLDSKTTNPEQAMDITQRRWINKKALRFYTDPQMISQELVGKHVSIQPEGLQGFNNGLKIEEQSNQNKVVYPPSEFLEFLTGMVVSALRAPPDLLTKMSEAEFATSILSNNAFFINEIRELQELAAKFATKIVRQVIKYSGPLQKQLRDEMFNNDTEVFKALEALAATAQPEGVAGDIPAVAMATAEQTASNPAYKAKPPEEIRVQFAKNLSLILAHTRVVFPNPNTNTDVSHSKEFGEFFTLVEDLAKRVYPDEFLAGEGGDANKETLRAIRAGVVAMAVRARLRESGLSDLIQLPELEDIDTAEVARLIQFCTNLKAKLDTMAKVLKKSSTTGVNATPGGGSDDSSSPTGDGSDTTTSDTGGAPSDAFKSDSFSFFK